MGTTTLQSAAARKPQPATPSRPMAQASPDHPAPMAMTVAELKASIAALPGKRDALREAFDRLAACSPSPLPFAWEDLDGHISSLQSSIALRFRQLRVLEAAGAAPAAAALGGNRGDGKGENQGGLEEEEEEEVEEEEVEVEEAVAVVAEVEEEEEKADEQIQDADSDNICNDEKDGEEAREVAELEKADEEMHEANSNKICNDEKDTKETREVEVEEVVAELEKKADEEMQEADYDKFCNDEKDRNGAREEVVEEEGEKVEEVANIKIEIKDEKEAREEEQASQLNEQDPDKDMPVIGKEELNTKDAFKASPDKKEDQDTNMDETAAKMASLVQHKGEQACDMKQEKEAHQQDVDKKVEVAKNAMDLEAVIANEVSADQGNRAVPCRSDARIIARTKMDAQRLLKLICTNTEFHSEFHAAACRATDAAALALHVVELFLHDKKYVKTNKVWASCVELFRMVPVVVIKPSADTIEQAKRVAKDWKEMIDNPESCKVLGCLPSWGLLYFLVSYNIVTEFDTKEIFCLFGSIPFKQMNKSAMLLKGLGLSNRIPELMDYLIGNGQQMDVLCLARVFNVVDKYPPLSLLKGYIEKAKQTAVEVPQKNMTRKFQRAVIVKELDNLRRAYGLAKKEITNSNLCTSIRAEINILIGDLEKKKQNLENPLPASTSNSQQQQTKSKKKLKIEQKQEHHKGQENQMQGQLSELAEKLEKKQRKPQQEQPQKQEDKPEEKKQKQENEPKEKKQKQEDKQEEKKRKPEDKPEEKQQQKKQKHQKQLGQHTHQLPTQGYPAMWNAALRDHLEYPPYAAMYGVHHGYPAQPGWSGVHGASPFMPQLGAPEYIGSFTPLYPQPQFYPR